MKSCVSFAAAVIAGDLKAICVYESCCSASKIPDMLWMQASVCYAGAYLEQFVSMRVCWYVVNAYVFKYSLVNNDMFWRLK